jgi:cell wall-associated NlpC family hydrolase
VRSSLGAHICPHRARLERRRSWHGDRHADGAQRLVADDSDGRTADGVVNALATAANNVTKRAFPYVYGGGHSQAGIASIGIKGPGYNGRRIGFDCSGSVAAVLAGGGLWPAGAGLPNDAGIISSLIREA